MTRGNEVHGGSSRRLGKGALFAPCPPSFAHGLKWWAHQRCAHSRDPISAFTRVFDALWALPTLQGSAAVLSVQVREHEDQRKRERPDEGGDPCPDFKTASAAYRQSAGQIDRGDKSNQGDGVHDVRSNVALRLLKLGLGCAAAGRQDPYPPCALVAAASEIDDQAVRVTCTSTFRTRALTVRKAKLVSVLPSGLFVSHLSASCLTVGTVEGVSLAQIPPLVPSWKNTGPPLASAS